VVGVPPDPRLVGGNVRDGERVQQLTDDLPLVRIDPARDRGLQIRRLLQEQKQNDTPT
jgi:hypothetical protein